MTPAPGPSRFCPRGTNGPDVTAERPPADGLASLLAAGRAGRNLGFGLVVGAVVAAGLYYTRVIAPAQTVADPAFYLALGAVLGLSIAFLLAIVLSVVTLYRRAQSAPGH